MVGSGAGVQLAISDPEIGEHCPQQPLRRHLRALCRAALLIGAVIVLAGCPGDGPSNTSLPEVSGVAELNNTLTASTGGWTDSPSSFAYQWQTCTSSGSCSNVVGATTASYSITQSDLGNTVRVAVTATNGAGSTTATSEATGPVIVRPTCGSATKAWVGSGDGVTWSSAANWSPSGVPAATDSVCIGSATTSVTIGSPVVAKWAVVQRPLTIQANLTMTETTSPSELVSTTSWKSGTISGAVIVRAGAVLEVPTGSSGTLSATSRLTNEGTLRVLSKSSGLTLTCSSSTSKAALLENRSLIELGAGQIREERGSGTCSQTLRPTLSNRPGATIRNASGASILSVPVLNAAAVENLGAGLVYGHDDSGLYPSESYTVKGSWRGVDFRADGASFNFVAPTVSGTSRFRGGTATGLIQLPIAGEVFSLSSASGSIGHAARLSAVVTGSGALDMAAGEVDTDPTVGGPRLWTGAMFVNTHTIPSGVTLDVPAGASAIIGDSARLINQGSLRLLGGSGSNQSAGVRLNCKPAPGPAGVGVLENRGYIELSGQSVVDDGGGPICYQNAAGTLVNTPSGVIRQVSGTGYLGLRIQNSNLVESMSGQLWVAPNLSGYYVGESFDVGGRWRSVTFWARNGSVLSFDGASVEGASGFYGAPDDGPTGVGAGWINLPGSADRFKFNSGRLSAVVTGAGTLDLAGGEADTDLTAGGPRLWTQATFVNTHTIPDGVTLDVPVDGFGSVGDSARLIVGGTLRLLGGAGSHQANINVDCKRTPGAVGSGVLENRGYIELSGSAAIGDGGTACSQGFPAILINTPAGVIRQVSGTGYLGLRVQNSNLVESVAGQLSVAPNVSGYYTGASFDLTGRWRSVRFWARSGSTLSFAGASVEGASSFIGDSGPIGVAAGWINLPGSTDRLLSSSGRLVAVVTGAGTLDLAGGEVDTDPTAGGPRLWTGATFVNTHTVPVNATLTKMSYTGYLAPASTLTVAGNLAMEPAASIASKCDSSGVLNGQLRVSGTWTLAPGADSLYTLGPDSNPSVQCSVGTDSFVIKPTGRATLTDGAASGAPLSISAGIRNQGLLVIGDNRAVALDSQSSVANEAALSVGDAYLPRCLSPYVCAFRNAPAGVITLNDTAKPAQFYGGFVNDGVIEFRGAQARDIRTTGDPSLGLGRLELDDPDWASSFNPIGIPSPIVPITLPSGFSPPGTYGACGGLVVGIIVPVVNATTCVVGELHSPPLLPNYISGLKKMMSIGNGPVWGMSASASLLYTPAGTDLLNGWSYCVGGSYGTFGGAVCATRPNGQTFDLEDNPLQRLLDGFGDVYIIGGAGVAVPAGPWSNTGYAGLFFTKVTGL